MVGVRIGLRSGSGVRWDGQVYGLLSTIFLHMSLQRHKHKDVFVCVCVCVQKRNVIPVHKMCQFYLLFCKLCAALPAKSR